MTTTPLTDQQLADLRAPLVARLAESTDLRVDQLYAVAHLLLPDLAELGRVRAELATTQTQIAAVIALPDIGYEALELMDPEQYHQAIGYNDGLAASTHAITDAAARPGA